MNCTLDEFEKKVKAVDPHKFFHKVFDPFTASTTVYALDTYSETQMDESTQRKLASYIWKDGHLIKDVTGTLKAVSFVNTTNGPITIVPGTFTGNVVITLPNHGGMGQHFKWTIKGSDIELPIVKNKKCECGAHSVGSKNHDSWCQLLGEI